MSHRDRAHQAARAAAGKTAAGCRAGGKWFLRKLVKFVTSKPFIDGIVMAGVFAVIQLTILHVLAGLNFLLAWLTGRLPLVPRFTVPKITGQLILLLGLVSFAFWARYHREEWVEFVEETTGEEAIDEDAADEGGNNGQ